jgi:trehalose utilization protein
MVEKISVTVWNEFVHEREDPMVAKIYPEGIHKTIAKYLHGQALAIYCNIKGA